MKDRNAGKKEASRSERQENTSSHDDGRHDINAHDDAARDINAHDASGSDDELFSGTPFQSDADARDDPGARASVDDFERDEWHGGFGVHGFRGGNASPRQPVQPGGYGEQGFGAGETRGSHWGGGQRGGYGGGQPGGVHGTRGGGWAAAGERHEQGRGPRSYGPGGWGGGSAEGRSGRGLHDASSAPWQQSEFAGRGEFGDRDMGMWSQQHSYASRPAAAPAAREAWTVAGPHTGRGPEGYVRTESAIRDDVCERLTRHGQLDAGRIQVQVKNGAVSLDGMVDSRTARRMAEETAESVSGVRNVRNRLRIDGGEH